MLDTLTFQRAAHWLHGRGHPLTARVVTRCARHLFGSHVAPEAVIGAGTELGYGGLGIVIHKDARLGKEVIVSPGVVIGGRGGRPGAPEIGDRVQIGAGAKVLGPIRIGDDAVIGANAVVLHDVAAGDTVVGIPAHRIERRLKVVDGGVSGTSVSGTSIGGTSAG
jgi:serine O-acetyltransferase